MPTVSEIGDVIAERRLTFQPREGDPQDVLVRLRPTRTDESAPHETWICPFQIEGIGSGRTRAIFALDIQALRLAVLESPLTSRVHPSLGGQFPPFGEPMIAWSAACQMAIEYDGDEFPPRLG